MSLCILVIPGFQPLVVPWFILCSTLVIALPIAYLFPI